MQLETLISSRLRFDRPHIGRPTPRASPRLPRKLQFRRTSHYQGENPGGTIMAGGGVEDFVVVVTGASTGLGRAIAVETARQGAKAVVINYARSKAQRPRLVKAARFQAVLVQGDVASDDDCRKIAAAAQSFGRPPSR